MSELSDEQLAAIRANAQEYSDASTVAATVRDRMNANDAQCLLLERHEDAAHTSAADVPFLLAHIDALTAENERLRGWREECDGMMVSTSRIASERDAFRAQHAALVGAVRAYREAVNALVFVTSEMTPSHPRANAWRESYGAEVKAGAALDALLPAADGASAGEVGSR